MSLIQKNVLFISLLLNLVACSVGGGVGFQQTVSSRVLSLNDPNFRTCVFDPGYSIVHFPMAHVPPQAGAVTTEDYEIVVKSQFQLLHTLLDYNKSHKRLVVFEESVVTDLFNESYIQQLKQNLANQDVFTRLDGMRFFIANERKRALLLFQTGFPAFYEHLNTEQKRFLWNMGASLTLYLLEEIPKIYQVIDSNDFEHVKAQLGGNYSNTNVAEQNYWVHTYRDQKLQLKVHNFLAYNPSWKGMVFIAYGRDHDFTDDFQGYPFQSGHSFCLGWDQTIYST